MENNWIEGKSLEGEGVLKQWWKNKTEPEPGYREKGDPMFSPRDRKSMIE